jgi:hypothetical protein
MEKYFKPKSLSWIAGAVLIGYGFYTKNYQYIAEGLAIIGIRGAIK